MGFYSLKVGQSPSKFFDKVFDAVLHAQRTLSKKTLTKFLMEDYEKSDHLSFVLFFLISVSTYILSPQMI
jgi:hypothetical protein